MSEEWGPWIEHDGKGCPVKSGTIVMAECEGPIGIFRIVEAQALANGEGWDWSLFGAIMLDGTLNSRVIRYRIRKPRGLIILEKIIADLPEEVVAEC